MLEDDFEEEEEKEEKDQDGTEDNGAPEKVCSSCIDLIPAMF